MIQTLKINDKNVQFNSSAGWLFTYQAHFGKDILPDIFPLIQTVSEIVIESINIVDAVPGEDFQVSDITSQIDETTIENALLTLEGLQVTTVYKIIWALAKNADDSIPPVVEWLNSFENFPLDEIVPEIYRMIALSCVSAKNLKRLPGMKKTKTPTAVQSN